MQPIKLLCSKIINIFMLFFLLQPNIYATGSDKAWLEAIKTTNTKNWQDFKRKKELMDINYDLYRITTLGPNDKSQITLAQDPRGYFIYKHDNTFCSSDLNNKCQLQSPLYTYGDIKLNVLLENLYLKKDKIDLATEIIRNIINPFPSNTALEMLEATEQEKKKPKNQAALAEVYASQARLGVARNTFNNIFFNRLPLDTLNNNKAAVKEKFSINSIIEQQAKNRFEDSNWHESLEKADVDTKLKEITEMESFKIWLDYQKYKQNERIESLLATLVAQQESIYQLLLQKNTKND